MSKVDCYYVRETLLQGIFTFGREASREERWDWDTAASEKREGGEC